MNIFLKLLRTIIIYIIYLPVNELLDEKLKQTGLVCHWALSMLLSTLAEEVTAKWKTKHDR
jgi:hypothetical protein